MNRHDFAKLAAGGCLAILFMATVSGPLGFGLRYTDQLKRSVRTTLDDRNFHEVLVDVEQRPRLRRTILLTGSVEARDRARATALVRSVPGVAGVRWVERGDDAGGGPSGFSVQYR